MNKLFKINDYELLSQKVYRILKRGIIVGDFKPGEKIFEVRISKQLGVSRTPIREALRELAAEGFVTISPNQGAVVNNASIEDIEEVLQIRSVLDGLAARLIVKVINEEEIEELEKCIEHMEYYYNKNDALAFIKMDAEFHELIYEICGSKRLINIHTNLNNIFHGFRVRTLIISNKLHIFLLEHKKIMEAIKMRKSVKAEMLSRRHVNTVMKNLLQIELKVSRQKK